MRTAGPATLKPGVTRDSIVQRPAVETTPAGAPIRGRALFFWDLNVPGKRRKLDAIDTYQITPAFDCVSESLETLDERWKGGIVPVPDARFPRS